MDLNALWRVYFGRGWETLIKGFYRAGAFIIDNKNCRFMCDDNILEITGLDRNAKFEEIANVFERLSNHLNITSPIHMVLVEDEEDFRAGYVYVDDNLELGIPQGLPVIDQAALLRIMGGSVGEPLLAIVQIEGISNPSFQDAYIYSAVKAMREFLPHEALIAVQTSRRYWVYVPEFGDSDEVKFMQEMKNAVENAPLKDEFGYLISRKHSMTISVGIGFRESFPAERMHTASFALYDATSSSLGTIRAFSEENYTRQKNDYEDIRKFSKLIDYNLFKYHYQPIIDAHSGNIIAYEVLMRTDAAIGFNPLQILNIAKRCDRLYDIEKATMFNAYELLSKNKERLAGKKLFINSISGHLLSEKDFGRLVELYSGCMDSSVIEFTEQTEVTDEVLESIQKRLRGHGIQLAIDDYGTGYSNTSNLIRYNPIVVKIDRSLISGVGGNQKKMSIVGNIIEFLHNNGYMALAEGVETLDELEIMIGLGADYIQGFYVAKPSPELLESINEDVKKNIIRMNLENASLVTRVHRPQAGEEVDIRKLATEKYTSVLVDVPEVRFIGKTDSRIPLNINVKDDIETRITLVDVNITSENALEVLHLGQNSKVELNCEGRNTFDRKGINVPKSSSLHITGYGEFNINSEAKYCFGIGNDSKHSHGDILIDLGGKINISGNGDTVVGIGAGKNDENRKIRIVRGRVSVHCSGAECVGIGTILGNADVSIENCSTHVSVSSPVAMGVGSIRGKARINCESYELICNLTGTTQGVVGVLREGDTSIKSRDGQIRAVARGEEIIGIGTKGGKMDIDIMHTLVSLNCEGGNVSGIGDATSTGSIYLDSNEIDLQFVTANGFAIGNSEGTEQVISCRKSIHINA